MRDRVKKLNNIVLFISSVVVAGCGDTSNDTTMTVAQEATTTTEISNQADLLDYFDGSKYLSESESTVGNGPDGPVIGQLTIDFSNGVLDWSHSGLVEQGNYEFIDRNSMMVTIVNASFIVPINTTENTIEWMGETYTREQ